MNLFLLKFKMNCSYGDVNKSNIRKLSFKSLLPRSRFQGTGILSTVVEDEYLSTELSTPW